MNRIKVCVVIVDRANYGRLRPVMMGLQGDSEIQLQIVCAATMLLERFGQAESLVRQDGFVIDERVYMELEGSVPQTMAKSIGLGIIEFTSAFSRLSPDIILLIGDRYEALAAAIAGVYSNYMLAHIQGGEVSGSIDESARHAITKLSHLHFPSTRRAAEYIVRMGEDPENVFNVGCPAGDYILRLDSKILNHEIDAINRGVGPGLDCQRPFFLVIFHSVTTNYESQRDQCAEILRALESLQIQTIWIWPNIDAGSDLISKALRSYRENRDASWLHLVKNIDPITYQKVLMNASCAIGNSSSFIRDSTFSGTPVVLVGDRQQGREHGDNLLWAPPKADKILEAVNQQLQHGRYPESLLYGDGTATRQIVEILKRKIIRHQKMLHYASDAR